MTTENRKMTKTRKSKYPLGGKLTGQYLTNREAECMGLLATGHTMRTAAKAMKISSRTVECYLANIKERFGIPSKSGVLNALYESGFWSYVKNTTP